MKKTCPCGKAAAKRGRCLFHLPPHKSNRDALLVAWFPVYYDSYAAFVLEKIKPLAERAAPLLESWYFINHFGIVDLGLRPKPGNHWRVCQLLDKANVSYLPVEPLHRHDYGGYTGVDICYLALQKFSELRFAIMAGNFGLRCDLQLMHYFLNQRGLDNREEGALHLRQAYRWLFNQEQELSWTNPPASS